MSVCPPSKEVITEASEACVVTVNLCTFHAHACSFTQKQLKVASLSLSVLDLMLGCGVGLTGTVG